MRLDGNNDAVLETVCGSQRLQRWVREVLKSRTPKVSCVHACDVLRGGSSPIAEVLRVASRICILAVLRVHSMASSSGAGQQFKALTGVPPAPASLSTVLVAGRRFCVTTSGADITVSTKAPQRSAFGWDQLPVDGVRAGYQVLQVLVDVFPSPVVAVRWFGDEGSASSSCIQSVDGSNSPSGACVPAAMFLSWTSLSCTAAGWWQWMLRAASSLVPRISLLFS